MTKQSTLPADLRADLKALYDQYGVAAPTNPEMAQPAAERIVEKHLTQAQLAEVGARAVVADFKRTNRRPTRQGELLDPRELYECGPNQEIQHWYATPAHAKANDAILDAELAACEARVAARKAMNQLHQDRATAMGNPNIIAGEAMPEKFMPLDDASETDEADAVQGTLGI